MPWITANGNKIEFPTALFAKIVKSNKILREDVLEALQGAKFIYDEAIRLNNRVVELEAQVLRLQHENEFMLRLFNNRNES